MNNSIDVDRNQKILSISDALEFDDDIVKDMAMVKDFLAHLEAFNERFAAVRVGASVGVADLSTYPPAILSDQGFNFLYQPETAKAKAKNGATKRVSYSQFWTKWVHRRCYDGGIVFAPGKEVPSNQLNLFDSFATEPKAGDWSLMEAHLRDVVCSGDERHYEWLMSWFADIVRNPGHKPGTAVCLKGRKGTGKSLPLAIFGEMIGRKYSRTITSENGLTGRFNAHLMTCLFAQVEEAVWAGNKSAEGTLKSLITSASLPIERKNVDTVDMDNYTRFAFTTNEDWALPASADERRYFIVNLSDCHMQDTSYFAALSAQMSNGGKEAWMHALVNWEQPDTVDLRNPPKTDALGEQVKQSLNVIESFFVDAVISGDHFNEDHGSRVSSATLYDEFEEYVIKRNARFGANMQRFGLALKKVWGFPSVREREMGKLVTMYQLPPRSEAKKAVSANMGIPLHLLG